MTLKAGVLFLTLCVGSFAFPAVKDDYSEYFDNTNPSSRIVGGTVAGPMPHMVGLVTGQNFRALYCGGSIITNRHILTAAHCITPVQSGNVLNPSVRGVAGTNHFASGGVEIFFNRAVIHPDYWPEPVLKHDIGIFTARSNIPLSNAVRIININYNWVGAGVATIASGWGRTHAGGPVSQVLLRLDARTIDANRCGQDIARRAAELNIRGIPWVDPNIELCVFHSHGRGMCNGDSGSALLRADRNEQIGIVSWALPCAVGAPDVFVRVSAYRNWIQRNTR